MPSVPSVKGFFCFTLLVSCECLLASVWFVHKPKCLRALEPSLDCRLSCPSFFLVTVSKNIPEVSDLNSKEVPHCWASTPAPAAQPPNHFASISVSGAWGGNTESLLLNRLSLAHWKYSSPPGSSDEEIWHHSARIEGVAWMNSEFNEVRRVSIKV